jgi:eukaryotic-like serine/threonine-protein kinase
MTQEWHQRAAELFHAALTAAPDERTALLEAATGGDAALQHEVESLLAAHAHAGDFIAAFALDASAPRSAQAASLVGHRVAHYEVLALLGAGGMGEVYVVEDTRLGRRAALKLLARNHNPEHVRRFEQEARAASALNHPNIVTVHDAGVADEGHFIVLELVAGRTLREMLGDGLLLGSLAHVGCQIARALSVAHAAGIVHRDIKPENVMVREDGYVKILDFGLARLLPQGVSPDSFLTERSQLVGTARYMSPEQARGQHVGPPSDVFSLGLILYEMAAGHHPFPADSLLGMLHAIVSTMPAPPSEWNQDISAPVDNLILAMLDKDAARRPTAAEVDAALGVNPQPDVSARGGAGQHVVIAKEGSRRRWRVYGIPAAAVGVAVLSAGGMWLSQRHPQATLLTNKDVLVLADFTNSTGEAVFDGTLREALAVQLEQSRFLKVMNDAQVRQSLRLMGRAPDERVTNEMAREVCIREREKAMIGGSITGLGTSYVILLQATHCETGETLAREQVEAREKAQVLTAVGVAARGMRSKLGESLSSIQELERHSVTQVTTPSIDAFQAYALGTAQYRRGLWLEAVPFFQRATELDPDFAMAFQLIGNAYGNAGERALSIEYSRRAFALIDRVSERERLAISAAYHMHVTGDAEKSADALHLFVQTFPRAPTPRNYRGTFYMTMGEFEKAARDYEESVRLDPRSWIGYMNLVEACARLGQFDRAKAVSEEAFAQKLDAPGFHQTLLEIALIQEDTAAAAKEIQWFEGKDDEYLSLDVQASRAIVLGQRRRASDLLKRAADQARRRKLHGPAEVLIEAAAADPFGDCQVDDSLVGSERACVDIHAALREAEAALKERPADTLLIAAHLPIRRAAIELQRNQPAKAIRLLESAAPFERRYPEAVYLRGLAYLRTGKSVDAATEFRKIIDHKGANRGARYPLAYVGLARAAAQQGDTDLARKVYQDFFMLWKDADPDIPVLIEAKKEYAALR